MQTRASRITAEKASTRAKDSVAPTLEAGLGFRIGRLARQLRRKWTLELKPLGLSPPQAAIVRGVAGKPGCSLRGLARILGADPMNVKRCVDELERLGLIRSGQVANDSRPRTLFLTDAGEVMAHDIGRLVEAQQAWLVSLMSLDEVRNLEIGLERLEALLG